MPAEQHDSPTHCACRFSTTPVLFGSKNGITLHTQQHTGNAPPGNASLQRFLLDGFRSCFTILSDCFSTFRHRTCSLSVSGRYFTSLGRRLPPTSGCDPRQPDSPGALFTCPRTRCRPHTRLSRSTAGLSRPLLPALHDRTRALHSAYNSTPPMPGRRF